ncbi:hypothetical protein TCAL_05581 [Tigriopus californicus]|uniref:Kelch-like protein diablo n=1 Tax=Tigriopus californicus TaxID=6832 RepID=A0A553NC00_TIGCA|nr:hypothetical protein TCAL_05581 [Tigriopus californicus]
MSPTASSMPEDSRTLDYSQRLLANLSNLRENPALNLCDVEIVPGWTTSTPNSKQFYAHRIVLAAASPYFNAMFNCGLVEANRQQIAIQSMSDVTLESLLNFIYSGKISITRDNVQDIIVAGDMIELKEVVDLCTQYLVNELEPNNAVGIFRFATDHNCQRLREATEKFIFDHFVEVSKGEEFRDLPREMLVGFLSSEFLRVDSEYQVFVAALSWVESDLTARRRFIFDVLKFIRLPLVPSKLLESYLSECPDISLRVALTSVKKDIALKRGTLVTLNAQPRKHAKKNVYIIGGSQREFGSAWTRKEQTYHSVEVFDTFRGAWHDDIGGGIERYDPTSDHWSLIAKMQEARFSMGIVPYHGLIYLVGGCTHSRRHMQELVSFNPNTGEWSVHASMIVSRSQMGCVVLDDHLYVLGGTNRHNEVLKSVERYSFKEDAWSMVPCMGQARASPAVASADGKIYVFGGDQINEVNFYRARTTISSSECYDPLTNQWTDSMDLPMSRSEAGAVVI